ncbi:Host cell surface-exposed lipoprotein [Lacticaseibacillus paracasei]|nr:Ltp family lipoprotein [Lacticaseibacillus paracasei]RND57023.1 Host cell surface-exposed lipoprotein [Lacticaseibacillus paracasei]
MKKKKPIYKRIWFWIIVVLFIIVGVNMTGSKTNNSNTAAESSSSSAADKSDQQSSVASEATSESKTADVPAEYQSALNKGTTYASAMNMSKAGVYDQLVSQSGEKFSAEAAQYAIDHLKADWNKTR